RMGTQACAASRTRSASSRCRPLVGSSDLLSRNSVASTRSVAWSEAPSRRAAVQRCSASRQSDSAIGRRAMVRLARQFLILSNMATCRTESWSQEHLGRSALSQEEGQKGEGEKGVRDEWHLLKRKTLTCRHSRESGNPAPFARQPHWIPAFAGMTALSKWHSCHGSMTPVSLRVRVVEAQIEQVNPTVDFPQAGKSRRSRPAFNNHRHVAPFPVVSCRVPQPG